MYLKNLCVKLVIVESYTKMHGQRNIKKGSKYVQTYRPNLTGSTVGYTTHDTGFKMDRVNIIDVFSTELWLMDGNF